MFYVLPEIHTGVITAWAGEIGNIPDDWHLCDGTEGTPDLRDKFILSACPTFDVGANGGVVAHNHVFAAEYHRHGIPAGTGIDAGTDYSNNINFRIASGRSEDAGTLPLYFALAFIQYQGT